MLPGRHAIRFHLLPVPCETFGLFSPISHSLRSVVPLGSFFGGCPPPPVTFPATRLNFRRATWLPFSGSFPKGATRFYPGAQENLSAFPSRPFGLSAGRQLQLQTALPLLSPRVSRLRSPIPSLVSKTVTFVTLSLIPKRIFRVNFSCVLFFEG